MPVTKTCECGAEVGAEDASGFGAAFLDHVREAHEDWPYPDVAVRNYGEALLRLTGPAERLPVIGDIEIAPVTEDRLADWTRFFDHDGFVGRPEWAACYCSEPHLLSRISGSPAAAAADLVAGDVVAGTGDGGLTPAEQDGRTWQDNRSTMQERLRGGRSFGYLAYVDGRPAGWVNASKRGEYALYRLLDGEDDDVVGVSCFVIAPPYRRHGLAGHLLDRVLDDAPGRGARWVEAYPFVAARAGGDADFRGPRSLYDERGFEAVEERERYTVVRKAVTAPGS
jgi:GNAT superfamily N-acetyltransferase